MPIIGLWKSTAPTGHLEVLSKQERCEYKSNICIANIIFFYFQPIWA